MPSERPPAWQKNVKNETIEGFMTGMPVPVLSQPSWDQCQAPNIYNGTWFIIISVWFFGFVGCEPDWPIGSEASAAKTIYRKVSVDRNIATRTQTPK